jgi:diaminohydroxyphosphoribosylaminopyrimidine deaminase/5-amino-6-(5-phosphoribosylamino)uracil reductase
MKRALKLAKKGLFTTAQNPRVGCVIVKSGKIVGEGFHETVGLAHAETFALSQAGDLARGSSVYVTLEPCSHTGKNPPCAENLIKAEVKKVYICNEDPNPLVDGNGISKLENAGIKVIKGIKSPKGRSLNCGFFHRMRTGLPFVRLKMAQSLDGRTAMKNGDSCWITGKKARSDVQYWRARSQAILTSIETVLKDDCSLTVRQNELPKKHRKKANYFATQQPMRIILDTKLRIPLDAKVLKDDARRIIFTCSDDKKKIKSLENLGIEIISGFRDANNRIDLSSVLKWLGNEQINELFVEAGATLAGQFVHQNLVQQLLIYTAPVIMGQSAKPLFEINIEDMNHRLHIDNFKIKQIGKDWRLSANL